MWYPYITPTKKQFRIRMSRRRGAALPPTPIREADELDELSDGGEEVRREKKVAGDQGSGSDFSDSDDASDIEPAAEPWARGRSSASRRRAR